MNGIKKILYVFLLIFILRIFSGCLFRCDCSDEVFHFDFSRVEIINLDNSQVYTSVLQNDTMFGKSVAFEIRIMPNEILASCSPTLILSPFNSAYAWSCDCQQLFRANQQIEKISIFTLLDINEKFKANTNVTDLFLASKEDYYNPEQLYIPFSKLYERINPNKYRDTQVQDFKIFLKEEVKNNKAQFVVNIMLSDNRILADTTGLLTIFIRKKTILNICMQGFRLILF